jgi:hypothetical protein
MRSEGSSSKVPKKYADILVRLALLVNHMHDICSV